MNRGYRRSTGLACVFAVLVCTSSAPPASAADSEFTDFRIPKHRWSSWFVDFSGSGRSQHSDFQGESADDGTLSGNLRSTMEWGYDSDRLQHRIGLSANLAGSRRHAERTSADTLGRRSNEFSQHDAVEGLALQGSARIYPWEFPLGVDLSAFGDASFGQSSAENAFDQRFAPFRTRSVSRDDADFNRQSVSATMSLGVGRVRDATGVYRARLLEQRLLDLNTLRRGLSRDAREKLAALFYVESAFSVPHDRPAKFFWREVERILREDGALEGDALDAYAVYRVIEPAFEKRSVSRNAGFFIGPSVTVLDFNEFRRRSSDFEGVRFFNDSLVDRFDRSLSDRATSHDSRVSVGGRAEMFVPIDLRLQFDAGSRVFYLDESEYLVISSAAQLTYLIADRWSADAYVRHDWDRQGRRPGEPEAWAVGYGGTIAYYLEDAWRLGLSWGGGNRHQDGRDLSDQQFSLGVIYRISGSLDAPGVVDPVRMMRATP